VPAITAPLPTLTWKVGDLVNFSGSALDPQEGTLPAADLSWDLIIHHCDPTGQTCHNHNIQSWDGVASGSFNAPDHGYPSYLELTLTATDAQGLTGTTSVILQPKTVNLTMATSPSGLQAVIDGTSGTTPFTVPVIIGSSHSISAPATQTVGSTTYTFSSWSDNGVATHNIVAPATATIYTATYTGGGAPPNNPPTAVASGSPTSGTAPLAVNFDGSASSDPDAGDTISYSWDLNGDGTFGDSTLQKPSFTYTSAGTYNAVLKVTDSHNASSTSAPVTITVNPVSVTTFGTTTPGTKTDSASANVKEVSKYTAPVAGNVTKVTAYISGLGSTSGSQKIRAVVYTDSGGNPGTLLGQSAELTINAGRAWGWVDFTFSGGVAIPAGTVWIGFIGATKNDLTQIRYDAVSNDLKYNTNTYTNGPSSPFGSPRTSSKHYSIYATYG
jgi:PKD repeat protein